MNSRARPTVAEANRRRARSPEHRFWQHVDKNGPVHGEHGVCWIWTGYVSHTGYGALWVGRGYVGAHRFSYTINIADPGSKLVCHKCDNPLCVKPEHLFVGTDRDNSEDKVAKGRQSRLKGEANGNSILTDEQVRYIRRVYRKGHKVYGVAGLAKKLGVSEYPVRGIVQGKLWKHVM